MRTISLCSVGAIIVHDIVHFRCRNLRVSRTYILTIPLVAVLTLSPLLLNIPEPARKRKNARATEAGQSLHAERKALMMLPCYQRFALTDYSRYRMRKEIDLNCS